MANIGSGGSKSVKVESSSTSSDHNAMGLVSGFHLPGRRSCLGNVCLLKVAVALMVVVSCHLLLQGFQKGSLEDSGTVSGRFDALMGQKAHRLHSQDGRVLAKCEVPRIDPTGRAPDNIHCRRIKPLPHSCQIAQDLFLSKPAEICEGDGPFDICQISKVKSQQHPKVLCDSKACSAGFALGTIDPEVGTLRWTEYSSHLELQEQVQKMVDSDVRLHDFCFIRCLPPKEEDEGETEDAAKEDIKQDEDTQSAGKVDYWQYAGFQDDFVLEDSMPKQLLILPRPVLKPGMGTHVSNSTISFNLFLLDSVSHSHFFRSLPKSIRSLRQIKTSGNASLFSFNLMQSLKGRTYENLQALLGGELYLTESPFSTQGMPPKPVQTWNLLKSMKEAGYQTMWTEDLCWTWEWGIAKNMVVHLPEADSKIRWKRLREVLSKSGIDGLNFSLASCEILRVNGVRDTFHGPSTICYNKKFHHYYTFEYLKLLQLQLNAAKKPYFHFTISNVAHEDSGRRLQTLDQDLADYLEFLSTQDNMVTILLADHGNSYGHFMQKTIEARVEMFHPVLIILMSENVAREIGPEKLNALSTNQDRLVSILDLHYTLQALSPGGKVAVVPENQKYDVSSEGLLVPLSPNRTCDSIPRIDPNVCICSNYERAVANDSSRAEVASAVLRKFNEVILERAMSGKKFGSCKELELKWFGNVKENYPAADVTIIKMDLHFDSGRNSGNADEVFFIIVKTRKTKSSVEMELVSYERMTSYSQYGKCKDPQVPTNLCICDLL